ncbi:CRISPR-associated protein Cas5 [Vulcanisaeta sp. JCM 16159]
MKVLLVKIIPIYSIRIPETYQVAISYPLIPPSTNRLHILRILCIRLLR